MPWPIPTVDTIYRRIKADMESRLTAGIKIPPVSTLGISAFAFAGASRLMYSHINWGTKQHFVDLSDQEGLTRWGNIFNLPRKEASYTTGQVSFTGTAAYVVQIGTLIVSESGLEYETLEEQTLGVTPSPISVEARALEAGDDYNTDDTELSLVSPSEDIDSIVSIVSGFDDGVDLESDEAWKLRLLHRFQNPPGSGNAGDYERWAGEVQGVGRAWCIPGYVGDGTVGLIVSDGELGAVSAGVLADVEEYVEDERPVPADVYYLNINPLGTEFTIDITPNNQDMRDAIEEKLGQLFIIESGPGVTVLLSHIRAAISSAGPDDYEITGIFLDSTPLGVVNIETDAPDAAVYDSTVFSALT